MYKNISISRQSIVHNTVSLMALTAKSSLIIAVQNHYVPGGYIVKANVPHFSLCFPCERRIYSLILFSAYISEAADLQLISTKHLLFQYCPKRTLDLIDVRVTLIHTLKSPSSSWNESFHTLSPHIASMDYPGTTIYT